MGFLNTVMNISVSHRKVVGQLKKISKLQKILVTSHKKRVSLAKLMASNKRVLENYSPFVSDLSVY
jgi:hypothetical protein